MAELKLNKLTPRYKELRTQEAKNLFYQILELSEMKDNLEASKDSEKDKLLEYLNAEDKRIRKQIEKTPIDIKKLVKETQLGPGI